MAYMEKGVYVFLLLLLLLTAPFSFASTSGSEDVESEYESHLDYFPGSPYDDHPGYCDSFSGGFHGECVVWRNAASPRLSICKTMMCIRKELLQTLAQGLPTNTIRFGSKISAIHQRQDNSSIATLDDGSQILPKVIIGCDGGKVARVWIPKNGWTLYVSRVREFSAGPPF
ncbi:hypothetical protein SUGI_0916020 [Cryptomeria japonica]|nr:hypothetical protein SUGI_0916020 [Cryptomeria japonica]